MNSLVVISSYPKQKSIHGKTTVGVASYAKNTLLAIKHVAPKTTDIKVLAEKLSDDNTHTHQGIEVKRIWKRGTLSIFPRLLKEIVKNHAKTKTVVVEFELSMFGSMFNLLPFPLFLLILRAMGKKIVFVNHQVIPNITEVGPHINVSDHSLSSIIYNLGLRFFYTGILLISSKVIVFEDLLKNRLSEFGSTRKIKVIPHGVEVFNHLPTKTTARKKLGLSRSDFVIVSFGYLAWYKGTDWLIYAMSELKKTTRGKKPKLILAGGPNPNHNDKKYYTQYIEGIQRAAITNGFTITGFVEQKDIPLYYQAADILVFPYRTFMSASGPLSMAFSFKKPFLLSSPLKGVLAQDDIQKQLGSLRLSENTIVFKPNIQSFKKAIYNFRSKKQIQKKLTTLSSRLSQERNWNVVGHAYYEEIFN